MYIFLLYSYFNLVGHASWHQLIMAYFTYEYLFWCNPFFAVRIAVSSGDNDCRDRLLFCKKKQIFIAGYNTIKKMLIFVSCKQRRKNL